MGSTYCCLTRLFVPHCVEWCGRLLTPEGCLRIPLLKEFDFLRLFSFFCFLKHVFGSLASLLSPFSLKPEVTLFGRRVELSEMCWLDLTENPRTCRCSDQSQGIHKAYLSSILLETGPHTINIMLYRMGHVTRIIRETVDWGDKSSESYVHSSHKLPYNPTFFWIGFTPSIFYTVSAQSTWFFYCMQSKTSAEGHQWVSTR